MIATGLHLALLADEPEAPRALALVNGRGAAVPRVRLPVLPHARVSGGASARPVPYLDLADVLTRPFTSDAHVSGYSAEAVPRRLRRDDVGKVGPIAMMLLIADVDDAAAHRSGAASAEAWWRGEVAKVDRLRAEHPGAFAYRTRGGYRLLYRLASPFMIASEADEATWKASYRAALDDLRSRYGIEGDRACADWTRLYRVPRATRDGVLQSHPTVGDPHAIGVWNLNIVQPTTPARPRGTPTGAADETDLGRALDARGLLTSKRTASGGLVIECPYFAAHSKHDPRDGSTVLFAPTSERRAGWLHCSHASCAERSQADFREELGLPREPGEGESVARARADLAEREPNAQTVTLDDVPAHIACAMRLATWSNVVSIATVPPGAGKTRAIVNAVAADDVPTVHAVPRHDLADEVRDRYAEVGVNVMRGRGILARFGPDGEPLCVEHVKARRWVEAGGSIPRDLCPTCPHLDGCPARVREKVKRVRVLPPQLVRVNVTEIDDVDLALEEQPRIVFDESPNLITSYVLTREDLDAAITLRKRDDLVLDRRWALACEPFIRALALALDDEEHDLVRACAHVDGDARPHTPAASAARGVGRPWSTDLEAPRAIDVAEGRARLGYHVELARSVLDLDADAEEDARRTLAIYSAVIAVAADARRIVWRGGRALAVHVPSDEARCMLGAGAVLLDATPDLLMLGALAERQGVRTMTMRLDVCDGASITREVIHTSEASRSRLAPGRVIDAKKVEEAIVRALDHVPTGARTLLVSHKPVADAIRAGRFAKLLRGRVALDDVAHFGGLTGLDRWREHDASVTLGDPFPHLGEAREIALTFDIDAEVYMRSVARRELAQAHGRLRAPSRSKPAVMVHLGAVAPAGWHDTNTTLHVRPRGRPRNAPTMTVEAFAAWVGGVGGQRAAARILGVNRQNVQHYLKGRALPPDLADRWRIVADARSPSAPTPTAFSLPPRSLDGCGGEGGNENPVKDLDGFSLPPLPKPLVIGADGAVSITSDAFVDPTEVECAPLPRPIVIGADGAVSIDPSAFVDHAEVERVRA